MIFSSIKGTGSYLPETILSNKELEQMVETNDEWIQERTGIKNRRIASSTDTVSNMGVKAALKALDAAQLSPAQIDMIIVATCTGEKAFPSMACLIQHELGIPSCPAFDVQAACSGFIYALSIADQFIRNQNAKNVLIIGSEIMSSVLDWTDRGTCILFGDGAGAVIVSASLNPGVILTRISADGEHNNLLYLNNKKRSNAKVSSMDESYLYMEGNKIFKLAVNILKKAALETIEAGNLSTQQIDWLVPHQANIRIIKAMAEKLGLPMERVVLTLAEQGNTSGASIPLALDSAIRSGQIKRGNTLLLEAFGGGLTWGSALVKY
ncbi:MAG: 3-oxoacyl-(acyl-carrier-protein) synthase [Francisellaceae bacterium]|nr:3-oxoacyl-(acyl-carrier-protein) synthase [Francisellaceae bacterium]